MSSRADKFTQTFGQTEIFSDFLNSFSIHPISGTLSKTTNVNAVRQSIKNLILTDLGERLFQPNVGSDIRRSLFEPLDTILAHNITDAITNTIKYNEPRARLLNVTVYPGSDEKSIVVNIVFSLINTNAPTTMELVLKRVR